MELFLMKADYPSARFSSRLYGRRTYYTLLINYQFDTTVKMIRAL